MSLPNLLRISKSEAHLFSSWHMFLWLKTTHGSFCSSVELNNHSVFSPFDEYVMGVSSIWHFIASFHRISNHRIRNARVQYAQIQHIFHFKSRNLFEFLIERVKWQTLLWWISPMNWAPEADKLCEHVNEAVPGSSSTEHFHLVKPLHGVAWIVSLPQVSSSPSMHHTIRYSYAIPLMCNEGEQFVF